MGNSLPISSPPKPSPSRAVIFMEPQCVRSYFREPWRRPVGKLQIIGSTDEVPPALDGVVPVDEYREMMISVADQAASYRGGLIHIGVAIFQGCLFLVIFLGFILSRYMNGRTFLNPITLGVLGTLQFGVLSQSGRFFQQEENTLKKELLELFVNWRQEYGIIAKMRKTKIEKNKKSSTCYCLVLEKMGPADEIDTVNMSAFTDMESEIESQV